MEIKDITFVIVTFHSEKIIHDCLKSLPNEAKKIIIENSNNSGFKKLLEKEYNNLDCYLMNENLGYGKANNIGINHSLTDYVFILNPDVKFEKNDLNNFLRIIKLEKFSIAAPTENDDFIRSKNKINDIIEVKFVKGFAMLLNKNEIGQGYFDENIFLYLEEVDLCKRVKNKLGRIIRVNVPINHLGGSSHKEELNIEMEKSRNWHWMWSKFYFNKKHYGYLLGLISTLPSFFSSLIKYFFYILSKNYIKKNIYKMRFLGLLNSYLLKKSFYRPNFDK